MKFLLFLICSCFLLTTSANASALPSTLGKARVKQMDAKIKSKNIGSTARSAVSFFSHAAKVITPYMKKVSAGTCKTTITTERNDARKLAALANRAVHGESESKISALMDPIFKEYLESASATYKVCV